MSKERGMIFNDEMVRAILEGRKTQTRRLVSSSTSDLLDLQKQYPHKKYNIVCPFGQPGDRLWVRETFQGPLVSEELFEEYRAYPEKFEKPEYCEYAADGGAKPEYCDLDDNLRHGWRPSIHMPRWASRILLEITDVRVERLHDISEEDAKAEGATPATYRITPPGAVYRVGFGDIWRSIYGDENWHSNPWVWVIEFKRVEGGAA
ncbi:morphogenetic protein [Citrobacter koseri]|nr:morphogenetic protein [Citrobacter koseri]